ncbi:Organic solvent tolerance protein OstA [Bacteroidales bacterium Barb6]|nr:Organic solvent tolerance protein OstA [Bacteroidales bacterium Barb6]
MKHTFLGAAFLSVLSVCAVAQTDSVAVQTTATKVYLEGADSLVFNQLTNPDAQILKGNVIFRHDSTYMYCDTAFFYELTNSLEAFGQVRMEQGDTLFVYGDYLYYDGNTQLANLRRNVRMENNQVTLYTDSLDYNRLANIGYYFEGGSLVDESNRLTSFYGQYSPDTKLAIFNDSVHLYNPEYTLYSDTLHYSTDTKIALILGPSTIVTDSGTIYTTRGWYDTANNISLLLDRSRLVSKERILVGDSIHYDRETGFGEAFGNIFIQDTAKHIILKGEYGYYDEKTDSAFVTDSACFLECSTADTLYLHADTLYMITVDSTYREVKAFHSVRFFRSDIQGVCDSMLFNTRDSVLYMYTDPILWNDDYQMTGDTICLFMNDTAIDYAHIQRLAFAIQQIDSAHYNQLKGNALKAFFAGKAARQIDVEGNAESIFFPLEADGAMLNMNETKSSYLSIWIADNKLEKLKIWPAPQGTIRPLPDLTPDQQRLKDFQWLDYIRPKSKDDIYTVVKRNIEEATPKRSSNRFKR